MLGRKSYTQEEVANAKAAVDRQLSTYRALVATVSGAVSDDQLRAVVDDFEAVYFNNMVLVLDRYFVHRLRVVTGKDGNPLNEVELLAESLINNNGVLRGNNVVKLVPDESVVKLQIGDQIRLSADDFERLATAFFADLEKKFL